MCPFVSNRLFFSFDSFVQHALACDVTTLSTTDILELSVASLLGILIRSTRMIKNSNAERQGSGAMGSVK